ncbi:hypothetical protein AQUCO_02400164v1 [Aquilegia coerulea]|nr:hypothetical protein AQUCO_02400164v1 [Aquilegia coerulea]
MTTLGHSVTQEQLDKIFQEVDSNKDGCIDFNEFLELNTIGVDSAKISDDLKGAFMMYDSDRNGFISPQELLLVMRSLGDKCSITECIDIIRAVDSDGDGLIDYEDFKVMMMASKQ